MQHGKLIIIDDSVVVRNYLSTMINNIPNLDLIHTASNGEIGFKKIALSHPDVVILDLEMEDGNGIYVLEQIEKKMTFSERPFVLIHSSRARHGDPMFKKAIEFGFCDFILKIQGSETDLQSKLHSIFAPKILMGIEAKKTRELLHNKKEDNSKQSPIVSIEKKEKFMYPPEGLSNIVPILRKKIIKPKLLILGASTGGPQVISEIVQDLDKNISIPVAIIQHMPETFTSSFAKELEQASGITTTELKHNMPLNPGKIYVFPGGLHGKLNQFGNMFVYYGDRKKYERHPFKPSIDLAIEYLINSSDNQFIYAILSGMGSDGAEAAKQLHNRGSLVFAQDENSCAVWGMPGSAVRKEAVDLILDRQSLGKGIQEALSYYKV